MTSTAFAPTTTFGSDRMGSPDTRLELVSRAHSASDRIALRVLIANGQPIVRHGLRALILREPDLHVIGETDDGGEAVRLARQLRPDVVLIDLAIPIIDGISATRMIRAQLPDTQVVVTSGFDEDASAFQAIRAGAAAYLLKDARIDEIVRTIRGAGAGQVALPARTAARMIGLGGGQALLSPRETEVLTLVARGLGNKQVARELVITEATVKTHMSGILSKLGLTSRTQLALYAARTGLVALDHLGSGAGAATSEILRGA